MALTQQCLNCRQIFYQRSLLPLKCIDFSFGGQQISLIGCFVEGPAQPTISDGPKICRSCLDQLKTCHSDSAGKRAAMANRHQQRPTYVCVTCGQLSSANNTVNMRLTVVNVNGQQIRLEECINACCEQDLRKPKTSMICLGCLSVIVEDYVKQATISVEVKEEAVGMEVEYKQEPELIIESIIEWPEVAEKTQTVLAEPKIKSKKKVKKKTTSHPCVDCLVSYSTARKLNYHRRHAHPTEKLAKSSKPPDYHECHHCDFKNPNKKEIIRHLSTTHFFKTDQQKCPICPAVLDITPEHNGYKEHISAHEINDNLQCEGCKRTFIRVEAYLKHKKQNAYLFICTRCEGVAYHSVTLLENHMETVHGYRYNCDSCSKQFVTKKSLESHIRGMHGARTQERCQLQAHMEKFHSSRHKIREDKLKKSSGNNKVACLKCSKSFVSKIYMAHHLLKVHGEATNKCDHCGKIFRGSILLNRHIQIVHLKTREQQKIPCQECDRTFDLRSQLSSHMRLHTGETCYDCKGCGMAFQRQYSLHAHMQCCDQMTPEVWSSLEKLEFKCQLCHASFDKRLKLVGHMNSHNLPELRKFKCAHCGKGFTTVKGANRHKKKEYCAALRETAARRDNRKSARINQKAL